MPEEIVYFWQIVVRTDNDTKIYRKEGLWIYTAKEVNDFVNNYEIYYCIDDDTTISPRDVKFMQMCSRKQLMKSNLARPLYYCFNNDIMREFHLLARSVDINGLTDTSDTDT